MSNAVAFLVLAAAISVVGGTVVALRHRRPTTFTTSIDDFSQRMSALAPEDRDGAPDTTGSSDDEATA